MMLSRGGCLGATAVKGTLLCYTIAIFRHDPPIFTRRCQNVYRTDDIIHTWCYAHTDIYLLYTHDTYDTDIYLLYRPTYDTYAHRYSIYPLIYSTYDTIPTFTYDTYAQTSTGTYDIPTIPMHTDIYL